MRAYLENGLHRRETKSRLYYAGPMFRRERPQKGRLRQFHQIGAECFGWAEPAADADLLCLLWDLFSALGLSGRVSLAGELPWAAGEDRSAYVERLREHLEPRREELCDNCRRRLDDQPAAGAGLQEPPLPGGECRCTLPGRRVVRRLRATTSTAYVRPLTARGCPYQINPRMVRGLDYYNRTTFELLSGDLGAQNAVAAGGRYDGLVETLGGPPVPALGFALGWSVWC